jgi:flagellar hook assembly protein FlgD
MCPMNCHPTLCGMLVDVDGRGQLVTTLVNGPVPAGEQTIRWSGRTQAGNAAASGVYFYRLSMASGDQKTRRMVLLK